MDTQTTQNQPPLLQYADLPIRIGIIVDPLPDGIRITQPPVPGVGIVLVILLVLVSPLWLLLIVMSADPDAVTTPIRAIRRTFRPMIIEITATTVSLMNVDLENSSKCDLVHPRKDVYDVRYVGHSNNVVIRVHGQEMIELRPFKDPRMQQWLADVLVQALRLK